MVLIISVTKGKSFVKPLFWEPDPYFVQIVQNNQRAGVYKLEKLIDFHKTRRGDTGDQGDTNCTHSALRVAFEGEEQVEQPVFGGLEAAGKGITIIQGQRIGTPVIGLIERLCLQANRECAIARMDIMPLIAL